MIEVDLMIVRERKKLESSREGYKEVKTIFYVALLLLLPLTVVAFAAEPRHSLLATRWMVIAGMGVCVFGVISAFRAMKKSPQHRGGLWMFMPLFTLLFALYGRMFWRNSDMQIELEPFMPKLSDVERPKPGKIR